jgi:hypothetical protein
MTKIPAKITARASHETAKKLKRAVFPRIFAIGFIYHRKNIFSRLPATLHLTTNMCQNGPNCRPNAAKPGNTPHSGLIPDHFCQTARQN